MAQTVGTHGVAVFTSPSNGDTLDATVVKGNDNNLRSAYVDHDADGGLHVQSSSFATRSSPGSLGRKWLTTDTNSYRLFFDDGSAWYEVSYLSSNGGTVTGDVTVTGTLTASVTGSVTGNASTATALQTARNINGVAFNGTADITVTAAAGTLSGSTLNSGVTASSLTSVGTLVSLMVGGQIAQVSSASAGYTTQVLQNSATNGYAQFQFNIGPSGANGTANVSYAPGIFFAIGPTANDTTTPLVFRNNNATERARIDTSGNLGLGVTPSAWATYKALQVGQMGAFWANPSGTDVYLSANYYFGSGADRYIANGYATHYKQNLGTHSWYTAPSGTAGNAISFTQAMTLDANGRLGIGTASPAAKLHINDGTGRNLIVTTDATQLGTAGIAIGGFNDTAGAYAPLSVLGSTIQFGTGGAERARIDASGKFTVSSALVGDVITNFVNTSATGYGVRTQGGGGSSALYLAAFNDYAGALKMLLDGSGNLGLGVVPSAWADDRAVELFQGALSSGYEFGISLATGAYRSPSNIWRYTSSAPAVSRYNQTNGQHQWFTAPGGTAGNAITFTQAMTLDASGDLQVGGTTSSSANIAAYTTATTLTLSPSNAAAGGAAISVGFVAGGQGPLRFELGGTERARIDASGNLGLGVTPSAWNAGQRALQFGFAGSLRSDASAVGTVGLNNNTFFSQGGSWTYQNTGFSSRYEQLNGTHLWFTAPSGTAGNAISFTQAMTLDASGNLGIGTVSPAHVLHVYNATTATIRATSGTAANLDLSATATDVSVGTPNGVPMLFRTSNTERARVKSTGQLRFVPLAADPAGAETGDVYYNSSTNKLRVYNGAWVDLH